VMAVRQAHPSLDVVQAEPVFPPPMTGQPPTAAGYLDVGRFAGFTCFRPGGLKALDQGRGQRAPPRQIEGVDASSKFLKRGSPSALGG
jgi:hypothetical protein